MARDYLTARHGELTGTPSVLDALDDPWRAQAACSGEPDEELFFLEMSNAAYRPYLEHASLLLPLLICSGCPVRRECLEVALTSPTDSGGDDEWRPRAAQRVFGIWGGTTEHDRYRYKDVPVAKAAEQLEATFPERIAERVDAWTEAIRARRAKRQYVSQRDRRVAALLGVELPPLGPRRIGRFHLHGRPGPGRGHRGPIAIYAAEHGCSRDTAWRRLRALRAGRAA